MTDLTDIQHHEANRAGTVVTLRLTAEDMTLLRSLADGEIRTIQDILIQALHAYDLNTSHVGGWVGRGR